jgi:hypothetical protein
VRACASAKASSIRRCAAASSFTAPAPRGAP